MNCKPGDLAVFIRSKAGNEGRLVEVVKPLGEYPLFNRENWCSGGGFCWLVKSAGSPLNVTHGHSMSELPAPDAWLRPIRPGDLDESTDTDIKKPDEVTA